ncbi:MAG TPA: molybdopterin-binding/glycosyltransferase family 2 protein [Pseudomonadota bacterium]|nr:molybdopterin-binding/glycosyltransferase family 2 protein [Pseudomonadota bacterium]
MKFGKLPCAKDLLCAHTLRLPDGTVFKKGHRLNDANVAKLASFGITTLWAAELSQNDVEENAAAWQVAQAVQGPNTRLATAATGRCNVYATRAGLFCVDAESVDALNAFDPNITLATLADGSPVVPDDLIATVKVIPFSVEKNSIDHIARLRNRDSLEGLVRVAPFVPRRIGLVLTRTEGYPDVLLDRSATLQRVRVERLHSQIVEERRCPHVETDIATHLLELQKSHCDPILILGASAIVDRNDVVPAALDLVGGSVMRLGMPVDPGNLLLVGKLGEHWVLGVPGCARSLRRSGFDFVLERVCAALPIRDTDIVRMGVGGLLPEVQSRPTPREEPISAPSVAAVVLAAGLSARMAGQNKLLALLDGKPLVAHIVDELLKTNVRPIVVVTGHQAEQVAAAMSGRSVVLVHNPDFANGLSTSLQKGVTKLGSSIEGALFCLGDMPFVRAEHVESLVAAFEPSDGREVIVPTFDGKRGNPVLFSARFFPAIRELQGDKGAKDLIVAAQSAVCMVPLRDDGVLRDIDTQESLAETVSTPNRPRKD